MAKGRAVTRLLVVLGSARRQGNTEQLAELATSRVLGASPAIEVRTIRAAQVKARPCLACGACAPTGECVVQDGMQEVYEAVRWADAMIIACPVYFASVTAQLKAVIDRFQCAWSAKYLLGKPWLEPDQGRRAVLLTTGGMRMRRHMTQVQDVVRSWLVVLNYEYSADVMLPGVDARGAVSEVAGLEELVNAAVRPLLNNTE